MIEKIINFNMIALEFERVSNKVLAKDKVNRKLKFRGGNLDD